MQPLHVGVFCVFSKLVSLALPDVKITYVISADLARYDLGLNAPKDALNVSWEWPHKDV